MHRPAASDTLHATAVALGTSGLLITGRSGSGKSSLALDLMSLGATLVADDRVIAKRINGGVLISAPGALRGRIEARGMGLLRAEATEAWLTAVVDLDTVETERLPEPRETVIAGERFRVFHRVESASFASMLLVMLRGGAE